MHLALLTLLTSLSLAAASSECCVLSGLRDDPSFKKRDDFLFVAAGLCKYLTGTPVDAVGKSKFVAIRDEQKYWRGLCSGPILDRFTTGGVNIQWSCRMYYAPDEENPELPGQCYDVGGNER